jgi:hypothetical protein
LWKKGVMEKNVACILRMVHSDLDKASLLLGMKAKLAAVGEESEMNWNKIMRNYWKIIVFFLFIFFY